MPRIQKTQIVLALAAAFSAPMASADEPLDYVLPSSTVPGEAHVTADRIEGAMENVLQARGNVVVTRDDQKLNSDWLDYYQAKNNVKAGDHFTLTRQQDRVDGTLLDYNLDSRTGTGQQPVFQSGTPGKQMRGDGREVIFRGKDNYRVMQSEATTCSVGDDSWYLKSSQLDLDYTSGIGTAYNAHVVFQGVPILYSPWLDFSLDGKRKSGLLYPTLQGGSRGVDLAIPYYFNLAPNYDATLTTHLNTKHGVILGGEFRYLQPEYSGWLYTEQNQRDTATHRYRYLWSGAHRQTLAPGLTAGYDATTVSDDNYFSDMGDRYTVADNVNLLRQAYINYGKSWEGGSANFGVTALRYQTLQATGTTVTPPYAKLPELTLNANQQLPWGLTGNLTSVLTEFSHPTLQEGQRWVIYPSISLPFQRTWGFFKPKLGIHATDYQLNSFKGANAYSVDRTLPIVSIDSGLYFDRQVNMFGGERTQTLEPRLFYLNVPARDQSRIPNFDSSLNDFGFAQIFTENDYSGYDRIAPANQVTAALTSQLIDNDSGREIIRAAFGQRFYFDSTQLNADGTLGKRTTGASDFLASLGGEVVKNWNLDSLYQYSATTHAPVQYNVSLRYQPAAGKVVSLRYRFYSNNQVNAQGLPENLHEVDLGVQWPLTRSLYALARTDYSLQDRQIMQQLAGIEYNSGCWLLRLVAEQYITNLTQRKTGFYFQVELKGLGALGTNPLQTLRLAIPGYTQTNDIQP
ncbi:LPS-assembly protein LptD [Paludibacterium sp. THUN1379]|uniref:LPS-assembly protein LptD n=1 Tax=Paludibacterium sp. THUN1379 TaxID=3112107 RepID=UPI003092112C|nr:LPS-assembly protein LptD [Paludibacterium sp. THUN1379]